MSKPHKIIEDPKATPFPNTGRDGLEYQPYAGLPDAPDPFGSGSYAQNLPGAPLWGGNYVNDQQMAGGPNPSSGTYAANLPDAPDYFTGYQGTLPGSPNFKIQNASPELPDSPEPMSPYGAEVPPAPQPVHSYSTQQSAGSGVQLQAYSVQELPELRMPVESTRHSPHWM